MMRIRLPHKHLADGAPQRLDARADGLARGDAEAQPDHVVPPRMAQPRIAALAGHVEHALFHRPIEQRPGNPGVDGLGQLEPDVQPAGRPHPADAQRRQPPRRRPPAWRRSSADSFPAGPSKWASKSPNSSTVGHQDLVEMGGAEVDVALLRQQPPRAVAAAKSPSPRGSPANTTWKTSPHGSPCRPRGRTTAGWARRRRNSGVPDTRRPRSGRSSPAGTNAWPARPSAARRIGRHIHAAGIVVIGDRVNRLDPRPTRRHGPAAPTPPRWPRGSDRPGRSPRRWFAPPDYPESPYRRSTSAPRRSRCRRGPAGYRSPGATTGCCRP